MMGPRASNRVKQHLTSLEHHLKEENPILVDVVQSFRKLDQVGYRMGLLSTDDSYAMAIPWWPLISVMGTFSAGKSSFINNYLDFPVQRTGTQAVDDKFTVLSYSSDEQVRELPGIALNSDPRFPFYQMSKELDKVTTGEGAYLDSYLRLKTCPASRLRGQILIDSPGFDADAQRTSTLRITDYIVHLSDLVLVLFDARHPEPGAMQDTLSHLVADAVGHRESSKFLYILNQIDTTAAEDNPEDVVSSWQRALAQEGLTAGRFYTIYNPDFAIATEDESRRRRFEEKRDKDLAEIHERMYRVGVERTYRIIGALEKTVQEIEEERVPQVRETLRRWARGVWLRDGLLLAAALIVVAGASIWAGYWDGLTFRTPDWLTAITGSPLGSGIALVVLIALALGAHFTIRARTARRVQKWIDRSFASDSRAREQISGAFARSTRWWRSAIRPGPVAWGARTRRNLRNLLEHTDQYIQALNDRFTNPSGGSGQKSAPGASASGKGQQEDPEPEPEPTETSPGEETEPAKAGEPRNTGD